MTSKKKQKPFTVEVEPYESIARHSLDLVRDLNDPDALHVRPSLQRQSRFSWKSYDPSYNCLDDDPDPDISVDVRQADIDLSTTIQAEASLGSIGADIDTLTTNLITSVGAGEIKLTSLKDVRLLLDARADVNAGNSSGAASSSGQVVASEQRPDPGLDAPLSETDMIASRIAECHQLCGEDLSWDACLERIERSPNTLICLNRI